MQSDALAAGPDGRPRCFWAVGGAARVRLLPRRGVGPAGPDRRRPLRAAHARGVPVRPVVADDPAQAAGVPGGVRGLRHRRGRGVRRRRPRPPHGRRRHRAQPAQDRGGAGQRPRRPARDRRARLPGGVLLALPPGGARRRRAPGTTGSPRAPSRRRMAKELKKRGFRFVGPTTAYSLMQAAGIVNDHAAGLLRPRRGRGRTARGGGALRLTARRRPRRRARRHSRRLWHSAPTRPFL